MGEGALAHLPRHGHGSRGTHDAQRYEQLMAKEPPNLGQEASDATNATTSTIHLG